jgi:hypothetical protein
MQAYTATVEGILAIFHNTILSPYRVIIAYISIHETELKIYVTQHLHMITARFIFIKTWRHIRCPVAREQIKNLQYICTAEYYMTIQMSQQATERHRES